MALSPMVGALLPFAQAFTRGGKSTGVSNLQDVKSTIGKYGIMRSCRGSIAFLPPFSMDGAPPELDNVIRTYCESFGIPSYGVQVSETRRYGSGPAIKYPVSPVQNDVNVTFIVDGAGVMAKFFNKWINSIVPNDSRLFMDSSNRPFDVQYKKFGNFQNYTTDILLSVYDDANQKTLGIVLYDAFPMSVSEMQMSHAASNDIARVNVTFSYSYFKYVDTNISNTPSVTSTFPNDGIIGTAIKVGTAVQTLSTLRKPRSIGDVLNVTNNASVVAGAFRL